MAAEILEKYGTGVKSLTLIPSGGGVFEITRNGTLIFSKKANGRFPELDEIFQAL